MKMQELANETAPLKKFLVAGFSCGEFTVKAQTSADALKEVQEAEWAWACSCGNTPDCCVVGELDEAGKLMPGTGLK